MANVISAVQTVMIRSDPDRQHNCGQRPSHRFVTYMTQIQSTQFHLTVISNELRV